MPTENEPREDARVLEETCLACQKSFRFEEVQLWEREQIKCPHCGADFFIVK